MFQFLRKWFSGDSGDSGPVPAEPAAPAARAATAPGTEIRYDPGLVDHLLADHRRIETLFALVGQAAKSRDAHRLRENLHAFATILRGHLLTENVRFYVYLQHTLGLDTENTELVLGFRKEMQHIGRALGDFLQRHGEREDWDEQAWSGFDAELAGIAPVLVKRIETEESILYPLYLPPR